jgi:hypothetical protein
MWGNCSFRPGVPQQLKQSLEADQKQDERKGMLRGFLGLTGKEFVYNEGKAT